MTAQKRHLIKGRVRGKPTKQGQIFFAQTLLVNRDETTLKSLKTVGVRPYFEALLTSIFDIETILSNTEIHVRGSTLKEKVILFTKDNVHFRLIVKAQYKSSVLDRRLLR